MPTIRQVTPFLRPAGHVTPPVDMFWHQRELTVRMPDGDRLTFAQYIGS